MRDLPTLKRVLRRWKNLKGVFARPVDNKLASAVMLARCCADPPPPSADCNSHGEVGGSSSFASVAPGRDEVSCLTSWNRRAEIATPSLAAFLSGRDSARDGPTDPDITVLSGSKRSTPTLESGVEKANRSRWCSISP